MQILPASGLPKRGDHNERFEERVRAELLKRRPFAVADLRIRRPRDYRRVTASWRSAAEFAGDARVGAALHWLFEQVTDEPERNERTLLLQLLEQYLDDRRLHSGGEKR